MHIYWFPPSLVRPPAKLGLCPIPGRSRSVYARELDLDALVFEKVTHVVALVEEKEFAKMTPPETSKERALALKQRGIDFFHMPILDFGAPTLQQARELTRYLTTHLSKDASVVVHCWAGLGRAGTIAACWLVQKGYSAQDAIGEVRTLRPLAIQSQEQEQLIFDFARS